MSGKIALVTGGARGQGLAHAHALAAEGADVAIVDICDQIDTVPYDLASEQDLGDAAKELAKHGGRVWSHIVDLRSPGVVDATVASLVADLGGLDIVVVNHGIWSRAPLWEMSEQMWSDMIDVNLTSAWRTLKATVPHLMKRGSGSIVLTSSINGLEANPQSSHYAAAKHGILGLMKTAAVELAAYRIRVNAVLPGFVDTPMTNWQGCYDMTAGDQPGTTREQFEQNAAHWHAIGGLLTAEDIANAVAWLVSDDASRLTGVELPVDGGHLVLPGFNVSPSR